MTYSSAKLPITVGIYDDHNAGIAAIRGGEVLLYCEFERQLRIKNAVGWFPELIEPLLRQLPINEVGAFCVPRPILFKAFLQKHFGAVEINDETVQIEDREIKIFHQDDLHPYLHILATLVMPEVKPDVYLTLVFDAEQPRMGWLDARSVIEPDSLSLYRLSQEKWFNGALFSDFWGTFFFGSNDLANCGKLMGLSSWGKASEENINFHAQLAKYNFDNSGTVWEGYKTAVRKGVRHEATNGLNYNPKDHHSRATIDSVASAQQLFTQNLVKQVKSGTALILEEMSKRKLPPPNALLYGGGCALSIITNALLRKELDIPIIIPPYAHDASQFVGSAVYAMLRIAPDSFLPGCGWQQIPEHSLGKITSTEITQRNIPFQKADFQDIARRIYNGEIWGIVEGGSEAGPRALGRRSLVANPMNPFVRDQINHIVKKREWYRPFAPSIPAEHFPTYFGEEATAPAKYMLDSYRFKKRYASRFSSVTDHKGDARPQSVNAENNPLFYRILQAMGQVSGHPVLLNTSLNAPGMTIAFDFVQVVKDCLDLGCNGILIDGVAIDKEIIERLVQSI